MDAKLNILRSQVVKVAGWKGNKENCFNSLNHLIETVEFNVGWSKQTIKRSIQEMINSGEACFKDNKFQRMKFIPTPECNRVPDYILLTKNIPDSRYHLDIKDWEVLCMIYKKTLHIHYVFENELDEDSKAGIEEQYFFGINYLNQQCFNYREIDLTYSEIRNSIQKLKLFFGDDFHRPPTRQEMNTRIGDYKYFYSYNFDVPRRAQWKSIIEEKIMELTGKTELKYQRPKLVTPEEKQKLDRANRNGANLSILEWSRLLQFTEEQQEKLEKGRQVWCDIKDRYSNLLYEVKRYLSHLVNSDVISEFEEHRYSREAVGIEESGGDLQVFYKVLQEKFRPLLN